MDLAKELCAVTGTELVVHERREEEFIQDQNQRKSQARVVEERRKWTVFTLLNSDISLSPGVQNPRDVTMHSDGVRRICFSFHQSRAKLFLTFYYINTIGRRNFSFLLFPN